MKACGRLAALGAYAAALSGCTALAGSGPPVPLQPGVVQFDLRQLDAQGNRPDAGFQPLTYEFCVPSDPDATGGVEGIDPTLRCRTGVHGRAGCGADQATCVGNTGQPDWRNVLGRLSAVPFVTRIIDTGLPTPPSN